MAEARIFIVDDNAGVREALGLLLADQGYTSLALADLAALDCALKKEKPALVLLDMNFTRDTTSGEEGLDALKRLPHVPVIMLTAWGTIEAAVTAMKLGAADYLTKPWDNARLLTAVKIHLQWRATPELNPVERVAKTDATVVILGESGTGKTHLARALAAMGKRKDAPFIEVHVGALPGTLFDSELFGHQRGAFTDARETRLGRIAAAKGGTLFLDEIGTLGLPEQLKLLRLLQDGVYEPLGSSKTERADVRIIAATNVDLQAAVKRGTFRADLFYRLAVFPLTVAPLRQRRDEIPSLVRDFISTSNAKHSLAVSGVSEAALMALRAQPWPGNIRELAHAVERACIMRGEGMLGADDFPTATDEPETLQQTERLAIENALAAANGNVSRAAAALGISRQSLYRRMERI